MHFVVQKFKQTSYKKPGILDIPSIMFLRYVKLILRLWRDIKATAIKFKNNLDVFLSLNNNLLYNQMLKDLAKKYEYKVFMIIK